MFALIIFGAILINTPNIKEKFSKAKHLENSHVQSKNLENESGKNTINVSSDTHKTLNSVNDLLKLHASDRFIGDANSNNVIIEYSSLSCPHCANFHLNNFQSIQKELIDEYNILYIHRHSPSDLQSLKGAIFTKCISNDLYFKYLEILFKKQDVWLFDKNFEETLENIAKIGGLYDEEFAKCLASEENKEATIKQTQEHAKSLGITHTPTFFVNGKKLDVAPTVDNLKEMLKIDN